MPTTLGEPLLPSGEAKVCGFVLWQAIFFYNVFMACVSFSIVMPSLFLYLDSMGATETFYALVVASYSVGEAIGSIALGSLSTYAGIKPTLLICTTLNFIGACSYGLAATADDLAPGRGDDGLHFGPLLVLIGRLTQGLGSGGQQAVEQSYLAVAARPEQRTELTGRIATFACMGFIFGPSIGALVGELPSLKLGAVHFNAYTKVGWVCALLNVSMYVVTAYGFKEIKAGGGGGGGGGGRGGGGGGGDPSNDPAGGKAAASSGGDASSSSQAGGSGDHISLVGVWALNAFFLVHFNGFAIQETLTTPLVGDPQHWL